MNATLSLRLDTDLLAKLKAHLGLHGGTQDVSGAIAAAIDFWLDAPGGAQPTGARGYQWKSVFLPEGTVLQTTSYGEHNYAVVEGEQIIHQGHAVSPNQFAQLFARATRNAWTDVLVRRPGDKHFKLASRLRKQVALAERAELAERSVLAGRAEPADAPLRTPPITPITPAAQAPQGEPASEPLSEPLGGILAKLLPLLPLLATAFKPATVAPAHRHQTPEPAWSLPERRKFRYRLEDVAFE